MRPALLLLLSALGRPALADIPTATATASAQQGPALSADLRDEYLVGERLLVAVTLSNSGGQTLSVPDLSARPWLVRFNLTLPTGGKQARYTTAPDQDPGGTWSLSPRGSRRVTLMVPSAEALAPGSYTLGVEVKLGDSSVSLEPRPVRLAAASPVSGQLAADGVATERAGLLSVWVHRGAAGFDLYLNAQRGGALTGSGTNTWLARLPSAVTPELSASRSSDALDRHVVWSQGSAGIGFARLESGALAGAPSRIDAPWPTVTRPGQSATDGQGALHVPLWVPAPQGTAGELRVLSVDERGKPLFRRVVRLEAPPNAVLPVVDAGGGAHFLVQQGAHLDLYSVRTGDTEGLPLSGRRLWSAAEGERFEAARFTTLEASDELPGGRALLIVTRRKLEAADQLAALLVSLSGRPIRALDPVSVPTGASVLAISPRGASPMGLLLRDAEGVTWREGAAITPIASLPKSWGVGRARDGAAALLSLVAGEGVHASPLVPPQPAP